MDGTVVRGGFESVSKERPMTARFGAELDVAGQGGRGVSRNFRPRRSSAGS